MQSGVRNLLQSCEHCYHICLMLEVQHSGHTCCSFGHRDCFSLPLSPLTMHLYSSILRVSVSPSLYLAADWFQEHWNPEDRYAAPVACFSAGSPVC